MLTLTNRIDMRPGAVPLVIHLGQYDSDFTLVFELYSSAGNFTVESGTTAMIRGTKTDGHAYDADATIDVSAKTVTVAGSEQMTAAKGRNVYELVLKKGTKVLSTANFILDVERAAMDADTIASESVLKELNAIIDSAATSTQAAADAVSAADRAEDAADSVSSASTQIATNTADIADLKADFEQLEPGLSAEAKAALLACFAKVAWIDEHGQDYYDALEAALYPSTYPKIEAVYSGGQRKVYDTETLNSLKDYLTVTYYEDENDSGTVLPSSAYTLTGILEKGDCNIVIAYNGIETTFIVTVYHGYRIPGSRLEIKTNSSVYPYYSSSTNRLSYTGFDILFEGGKTYEIEMDSDVTTANMGIQGYNQRALLAVQNHQNFATEDIYDPGWQSLPTLYSPPAQVNNSDFAGIRFTLRKDAQNSTITTNFVDEIRITEVD